MGPAVNEGTVGTMKQFIQNSITIKGSDYLTDITLPNTVTVATQLQNYIVNPLLLSSNSRLAKFALLYDKYKVNSLQFRYKPSVGTGTAGQFQMAIDYDQDDNYIGSSGPVLNQQLSGCADNIEFPAYHACALRSTSKSQELFIQNENGDPRLCNWARVWLATVGGVAAGTYGYLTVDWSITLSKPNNDPDGWAQQFTTSMSCAGAGAPSSTYPWGNFAAATPIFPNNNLIQFLSVIPGTATAASVIQFMKPGAYMVTMNRTGVAMGTTAYTPTGASNCVTNAAVVSATSPGLPSTTLGLIAYANGASTATMGSFTVSCSVAGGYIYGNGDSGPTHSTTYVIVSVLPSIAVGPAPGPALSQDQIIAQCMERIEAKMKTLTTSVSAMKAPPLCEKPKSKSTVVVQNADWDADVGTVSAQVSYPGTNAPVQNINFTGIEKTTAEIGYPTDGVFIEPIPMSGQRNSNADEHCKARIATPAVSRSEHQKLLTLLYSHGLLPGGEEHLDYLEHDKC